MKLIFTFLVLVSFSSIAASLPLKNYLKLQDYLASDDLSEAQAVHKQMCEKELKSFKETYKDCVKSFKDIEDLRTSFKQLSVLYISNSNKTEMKDLIVAECPMAKAKWIQPKGGIRNPYYGKSMLECGQKI